MRFIFLLLLIFSSVSCQSPSENYDLLRYVDPEIERIVDEFKRDADSYDIDYDGLNMVLRIVYRPSGYKDKKLNMSGIAGLCKPYFLPRENRAEFYNINKYYREIWIAEHYRNPLFEVEYFTLKSLVYHELGHCVYNLTHHPDQNHIMYWEERYNTNRTNWRSKVEDFFKMVKETR